MSNHNLILVETLCPHYEIEISFFDDLLSHGLISITKIENRLFIHPDEISNLERIIRLYSDLNVNFEGIDIVMNLLQKEKELKEEIITLKNRLRLFENA